MFCIVIHPYGEGENDMRVSEGVSCGRNIYLYHPEMFQDHEEIVVFTREEFQYTYNNIREQIDYMNKVCMNFHLDSKDYLLLGYWPKLMERVNILNRNMDSIFKQTPTMLP